jgi:hypothetical protein
VTIRIEYTPTCRCHERPMRWVWGLEWVCSFWAQREGLALADSKDGAR